MNNKQVFVMKRVNENRIRRLCPDMHDSSGIYVWWRKNENGYNTVYVGQAKNLVARNGQHLQQFDHLGRSIKKHGLATEKQDGWHLAFFYCSEEKLDTAEKNTISKYIATPNVVLYNITSGGQDAGKVDIGERKASKGYHDGLEQGYKNAQKFVANLFEKNLKVEIQGNDGVLKQKALKKFLEFIKI